MIDKLQTAIEGVITAGASLTRLAGGDVWATLSGDGEGVPDGMKTDLQGRIFCNGPGGVHVFSADANRLGRIATPEKSTNFASVEPTAGRSSSLPALRSKP